MDKLWSELDKSMAIGRLGKELGIEKSRLGALLKGLKSKGFVEIVKASEGEPPKAKITEKFEKFVDYARSQVEALLKIIDNPGKTSQEIAEGDTCNRVTPHVEELVDLGLVRFAEEDEKLPLAERRLFPVMGI